MLACCCHTVLLLDPDDAGLLLLNHAAPGPLGTLDYPITAVVAQPSEEMLTTFEIAKVAKSGHSTTPDVTFEFAETAKSKHLKHT